MRFGYHGAAMGTDSLHVSALIPASPEAVYEAWLSSEEHGLMTGEEALIEPHVGGSHRAHGDYIEGKTLALDPGKRIVQTWRTLEFPQGSSDSQITVMLAAEGDHTRITIAHTEIPEGQGPRYDSGWREYYFAPMVAYFRGKGAARKQAGAKPAAKKVAAKKTVKKAPAKKTAAKKIAAAKPAAKKTAAAKPAAKKTAAKKTVAKKTARKGAAK